MFGSSVVPLLPRDSEGPPGGSYPNSSQKSEGSKPPPIVLNCNVTLKSKTLKLKLKRGVGMTHTRVTYSSHKAEYYKSPGKHRLDTSTQWL